MSINITYKTKFNQFIDTYLLFTLVIIDRDALGS